MKVIEKIGLDNFEGPLKTFCGFQVSGDRLHFGHVLALRTMRAYSRGGQLVVLLADAHARLNDKDYRPENIQKMADAVRKILPEAKIITSADLIQDPSYWTELLRISCSFTLRDLGRSLPDDMTDRYNRLSPEGTTPLSMGLYVMMQVLDPHHLGIDLVVAGLDQRRIYMRERELPATLGHKKPAMIFIPLFTRNGRKLSKSQGDSLEELKRDLTSQDGLILAKSLLEQNSFIKELLGCEEPSDLIELIKDIEG